MKSKVWFCLRCSVIGEIEHDFANHFDVMIAVNRDHITVSAQQGKPCRALIGFGRMLAMAAGER